ncbi:MAG: glycoside hydrolase family 13 protein [Lutibacter sp.]|uniref:glycoside hydrolase family 13 protein n=1 Tax=Lutibacter sp. TaxID=1925666 RepID=UPI00182F0398|nr:glycoside hydrolase family 13 protein [Lutibacter sp.]MBT8316588.1 glycoside hydrolase family 13 protein [Lutibacter sp.]NNJ57448.1 glycoside hydrolase family 13 protein [Lutibacter sp.]
MKKVAFIIVLFISSSIFSQVKKMEPPFWWIGMKNTQLELMIYGEGISKYKPSIENTSVKLVEVKRTENDNYLFLKLNLENAKSGIFKIDFLKSGRRNNFALEYELKERVSNSEKREGFNSSDVIYLITPDRFANADTSNDIVKALKETKIDRKNDYARHGGDIKGITNHIDYIDEMGFTAIWSTPVLTNDMKQSSYHGYAITDLYQPDPRFGTLDEYIELAKKSKEKGIKLVMDQVANHIGSEHWWMKDLPANDWINYQTEFLEGEIVTTNHRRTTNQDSYAAIVDSERMTEGWFVSTMPDLNQRNSLLSNYLIQNSIWWVELLDLGGIRQDTYPYPDKEFMSKWAGAIMTEYPNFSIVGEEWSLNPLLVGYWQDGHINKDGYKSNLTSSMDFPMQRAIVEGLNEDETWGTGFVKMYEGLANDFSYTNPSKIMIFPDNHDMSRIFTQLNEDITKTKMALGYILALPRISQIYYGTEILLSDAAKPGDHGLIRTDFPGGWKKDKVNAFTGKGLSSDQKEMQSFLKKVLNYRKNSEAIHSGKTIHFAPEKGVYVLFRILDDEVVAFILNKNEKELTLDLNRFDEIGLKGKEVRNIISNEKFVWEDSLKIDKKGIIMLTSKK